MNDIATILLLLIAIALLATLLKRHRALAVELRSTRELVGQLRSDSLHLFNQFESYHYLRDRLGLRDGLPYTRNWSAQPDFQKLIVEHCLESKPRQIVECSSGLTTLLLARCCQLNGGGRVVSLENGAEYAQRTRDELLRYGLAEYATVLHAPLEESEVDGDSFQWYSIDELTDEPIDMLVIDGPPGFIQHQSRYPALPKLVERLADGCEIFLDDAGRVDERALVKRWLAAYPGLSHDYIALERGCSVLRLKKTDND